MYEHEIIRKITDFRALGIPPLISRSSELHYVKNMVSTVVGARRTGKSFRALQAAQELITNKTIASADHICHLDFDNPVLSGMSSSQLGSIQTLFLQQSPSFDLKTPIVFVFDELHKIEGWEEYVIDLSRNPHWRVIVTGSSAKMLREDMATELRGKAISSEVYPLSFAEYLTFRGMHGNRESTRGIATTRRLFDEYLHRGAYPAAVDLSEPTLEQLLGDYFDTMCLRDIIQRHDVSKPAMCITLYRYLLSLMAKPFTNQSAFRHLKGSGFDTSRGMVQDLIEWAADAWLFFSVPLYSDSVREQGRNYKKLYVIDWGLSHVNSMAWDGSYSRSLENLVYLHLRQRFHRVQYYLTGSARQEVDFVAVDRRGKPCMLVQVCTNPSDKETLNRELAPLAASAAYFGVKENILVTLSHEMKYEHNGVIMQAVPAWRWLLD